MFQKIVFFIILFFSVLNSNEIKYKTIIEGIKSAKIIKESKIEITNENILKNCNLEFEKNLEKNYEFKNFKETFVNSCCYNLYVNNF